MGKIERMLAQLLPNSTRSCYKQQLQLSKIESRPTGNEFFEGVRNMF